MQHILVLGGGAAGLAAALAAAQTAKGSARITVLDRNAKVGKKLLATGNGRCNLDNRDISPERYFTSSPKALRRLLEHPEEARQMGENGRRAVREAFNWSVEEQTLLGLYRDLSGSCDKGR